jgi:hypothetical protein
MKALVATDLLPSGMDNENVLNYFPEAIVFGKSLTILDAYVELLNVFPDIYVNAMQITDGSGNTTQKRVFNNCGWRSPDSRVGAPRSAHKIGRALDLHVKTTNISKLYDYVRENYEMLGISRIEDIRDTPTWVHIDNMAHQHGGLRIFRP